MDFYGLVEKVEFQELINQAKKTCLKSALNKLRGFDPMNEKFFKAAMPENTPDIVIKKRTKNKLYLKKQEKDLKRLLG